MIISEITINDFRNLSRIIMTFSRKFNAIHGKNAAGKSTILEAIYYLSTGRSFRNSAPTALIAYYKPCFTLFAKLSEEDSSLSCSLGLSRDRDSKLRIHLNEENFRSINQLSRLLPSVFIGPDAHSLLTEGPKIRRQFLDWGLFYTYPQFYPQWQHYQKLLTQRNAALKHNVSRETLDCWSAELAETGERIDKLRQDYLISLLPSIQSLLTFFLSGLDISIEYLSGWEKENSLFECLSKNIHKEKQVTHTLYGPHRADLALTVDNLSITDIFSQGQQKLLAYAMKLSQGIHFKKTMGQGPIYLIDDLPSELDWEKQKSVGHILNEIGSQVFVTGIHPHELEKLVDKAAEYKMFHVKHGEVHEALSRKEVK